MAERDDERDLVSREAVLRAVRRVMRECVSGTDAVAALEEVEEKSRALPSAHPQGVPESVREHIASCDQWVRLDVVTLALQSESGMDDGARKRLHDYVVANATPEPGLTDPAPADEAGGGERVNVPLLRAMQQWECVAKGEHGDTCLDRFADEPDAPEQCAPCLARRVLRAAYTEPEPSEQARGEGERDASGGVRVKAQVRSVSKPAPYIPGPPEHEQCDVEGCGNVATHCEQHASGDEQEPGDG